MKVDITRPQIGRIYDYVLGGTYNYEPDRQAAEGMVKLMPAYPSWARYNRAFLGEVGRRWAAEGRKRIIDLGSGLPTQGHFNEFLPGAKILFSDLDPLTVAQGQQLLAYSPDMAFFEIDLHQADALIEQAAAFFGAERSFAVGCIGVAYFIPDDAVKRLMQRLHAFTGPDSVMAVSWPVVPDSEEVRATIAAASEHARVKFWSRTPEEMTELLKPWRMAPAENLGERFAGAAPPPAMPDHPMHRTQVYGAFVEH